MTKIKILARTSSLHQSEHARAMALGLSEIGVDSKIVSYPHELDTRYVAVWGWRQGKELRERGHDVLVMERGYIGDRFKYTSLGWNGLNGYATFPSYEYDAGNRFRDHGGIIKPWSKEGHYTLIMGQVRNDASLKGLDLTSWYQDIADSIRKERQIDVRFRPHPESVRRGGYTNIPGIENISGSLEEALSGSLFTVAYNSNSCLDSILAGKPCLAGDKGTMAWDLCMRGIKKISYPERESTVHRIAWTQWTLGEIASGLPLKKIMEMKL